MYSGLNGCGAEKANCCEFIEDLIYGVTPEKLQQRAFYRKNLPMLREGGCFKICKHRKTKHNTTATNVSSFLGSMFSGGADKKLSTSGHGKASQGEGVWVSLIDEDTVLEWKTLANENNEPKASRHIPMHTISRTVASKAGSENDDEARKRRLTVEDKNGDVILELEADSAVERDLWVEAMENALEVLKPDLEKERRGVDRSLQLQQKRLDIVDRDRARQERKRKLTKGSKLGMKYTAQAMARAST
jgi:hypothetical protein